MSDDDIVRFLREQSAMVVGTTNPNGRPHLVTVFYGFMDDRLVFTTYAAAQKAVNIGRDPRISCLVEDIGSAYSDIRGVLIYGRARVVDDKAQVAEAMTRVVAHLAATGRHDAPEIDDLEHQVAKRVAVLVEPERTASWDHGRLDAG
jgi:PPOX class probable F420-dependent enzyme